MKCIFVGEIVRSENEKICTECFQKKSFEDFYKQANGRPRSKCKKCIIKLNYEYQKRNPISKCSEERGDKYKKYQRQYYLNNKEKFSNYRSRFKERNPDYYRQYVQRLKNEML